MNLQALKNELGDHIHDAAVSEVSTSNKMIQYLKGLMQAAMYLGNCRPANGRTYWVDPDEGDDDNDGLTFDKPMKTLPTAVTAAEAYRTGQTTNVHIRNRIMLFGGVSPHTVVTELAQYCDYYGIGADPLGDGIGIARIGTGVTNSAVTLTATHRGMYFKNIQFIGAGGKDAFLATVLLRTTFEDCVFGDNASAASAVNAGFKASSTVAGCTFRRCRIGMTNTATYVLYGIYAGGQFSQNLIRDCEISGVTAGIYLHTDINAVETVIRDNVIGDFGGGCAKGIDDNSNGLVMIVNNRINAADGIEKTNGGEDKTIGNIVAEGSAGSRVSLYEGVPLVRTS